MIPRKSLDLPVILVSTMVLTWNPIQVNASNADHPKHVVVTNFPESQDIAGSVTVDNFPVTQSVEGAVEVSNFPATQSVEGAVEVSNFPASQTVDGSVSVSNFPAVQNVSMASPLLASNRVTFSLTDVGDSIELLVPEGVVMTDFVIYSFEHGGRGCLFKVWDGPPSDANLLLFPELPNREILSLHLESGLEGPITMQASALATGSGSGFCSGNLFWSGYIQ